MIQSGFFRNKKGYVIFVVNDILYRDLQNTCAVFMAQHKADQQYLYSNFEQKQVKIGATYGAFEFAGKLVLLAIIERL